MARTQSYDQKSIVAVEEIKTNNLPKRKRSRKSRAKKLGLPPGTAVYTGEQKVDAVRITAMVYSPSEFRETIVSTPEECIGIITDAERTNSVVWINVEGLHDVPVIEKIATPIGLHPLVIEDIVSTTQRPKSIDYSSYLHAVIKMLTINHEQHRIESEQVSLILGSHFVISFQERLGDCFDPLRDRIRIGKGRARSSGSDYLFYALIDSVVDHYFVVVEEIDDRIERLEEELLTLAETKHLADIHRARRELLDIRRAVWPLREVLQGLIRDEGNLIKETTQIFLRDVYDHAVEVIEVVELLRDTSGGLIELYMSQTSNKVNLVMKTLTVIATIFMPLTFIVGVYGMNFDYLPELHWQYGYAAVWAVMITITIAMLIHFKKKEWL